MEPFLTTLIRMSFSLVWTPFTHPSSSHRDIISLFLASYGMRQNLQGRPLFPISIPAPSSSQWYHMTWGFSHLMCPLTWTFLCRPGIPGSFPTLGTRFSSAQLNRSGTTHWAAFFFLDFGLAPGFCLSYHIPILFSTDSTPSTLLTFRPPVPSRALDSCPSWGGRALQVGQMPTVSWKGFLAQIPSSLPPLPWDPCG